MVTYIYYYSFWKIQMQVWTQKKYNYYFKWKVFDEFVKFFSVEFWCLNFVSKVQTRNRKST